MTGALRRSDRDPSCEDRLTDAGTIAAVVTRRDGGGLLVEEIAVSCRALGRGVEDAMLCAAVVRAMDALGVDAARFAFVDGPRNGPARSWLAGLTDGRLDGDVDRAALESRMQALDGLVTMTWEQDG